MPLVGCTQCGLRVEVPEAHLPRVWQMACQRCAGPLCLSEGATQAGSPGHRVTPRTTLQEPSEDGDPAPRARARPVSLRPGSSMGRYELLEHIAQGGFGSVFRARDPRQDRDVAVKVLMRSGERARGRFEQEIRATARLRHPNIVTLLDSGEQDGVPFLVMEHVPGRSLAALCQGDPPPIRDVVRLLASTARAVDYAHQQGVLHRDLKPENVIVDRAGQPRVVDLGLARVTGSTARLTQTGEAYGTPAFMAPEQAGMGEGGVDERTDVYSLGATLYSCLSGRLPFEEAGVELFLAMFVTEPPPPSEHRPTIPAALDLICLKCLEKEPAQRYQSAAALADDLQRWLDGEPILARPTGPIDRVVRSVKRHRVPIVTAIVGVAVGAVLGFYGRSTIPTPPPTLRPERAAAQAPAGDPQPQEKRASFEAPAPERRARREAPREEARDAEQKLTWSDDTEEGEAEAVDEPLGRAEPDAAAPQPLREERAPARDRGGLAGGGSAGASKEGSPPTEPPSELAVALPAEPAPRLPKAPAEPSPPAPPAEAPLPSKPAPRSTRAPSSARPFALLFACAALGLIGAGASWRRRRRHLQERARAALEAWHEGQVHLPNP